MLLPGNEQRSLPNKRQSASRMFTNLPAFVALCARETEGYEMEHFFLCLQQMYKNVTFMYKDYYVIEQEVVIYLCLFALKRGSAVLHSRVLVTAICLTSALVKNL